MAENHNNWSEIIILILTFSYFVQSLSSTEGETLVKFKRSLRNANALSGWDNNQLLPCQGDIEIWVGVLCEKGFVWGLKLENMGLSGVIDVDVLMELKGLRTISLMNNNFDGPLPILSKLGALKSIYLTNNHFYGQILPWTFTGMSSLKKLYLGNNNFTGVIPKTLSGLSRLKELSLENNEFDGAIPAFEQERFRIFNLSHNNLSGAIPDSLNQMDASSFSGNSGLCGAPLKPCNPTIHLSLGTKIIVGIIVAAALAALIAVVFILCQRKQTGQQPQESTTEQKVNTTDLDIIEQGPPIPENSNNHVKRGESGVKLTFLDKNRDTFDMSDLLKASAEILGSGVFGSTYKAALNDGNVMVVKRFRHMNNVNREEFHEHMRRLGRLNHPNVITLVAFYYRKEEKLLVTEFVKNNSLAVHLHANRSRGLPSPDWPTRLKIVKGVANGLKYLYNELPSLTAPHGHLKSSNVLLDGSYNPLLTDYGLVPVVNQEHGQSHMISYKSPEYKNNRRITKKTDVWALGILILEILTGRFPSNFVQHDNNNDSDLVKWVDSMENDEAKLEVFDPEMDEMKHSSKGEMMKLLRIGLNCCTVEFDKRPDIREAVEKIEEVKEKDHEDDFYSAYASDIEKRSSRGLSDDFTLTFN